MGGDGVLSTPSMIALMERASIQAVQGYLPEGHTTVGFEVHVKHSGATPKKSLQNVMVSAADLQQK
jgi:predicted thioesterase